MTDAWCGTCLDAVNLATETIIRIDPCGHLQHQGCLTQWETERYRARDCPSCRRLIVGKTQIRQLECNAPPECSICLDRLIEGVVYISVCGHEFHAQCLHQWQQVENTCPLCRSVIDQTHPRGFEPIPAIPDNPIRPEAKNLSRSEAEHRSQLEILNSLLLSLTTRIVSPEHSRRVISSANGIRDLDAND